MARIRLARTDGIGPVGFGQLLAAHGSAGAACDTLEGQGKRLAPEGVAAAEIEKAERVGARHVLLGDADYPPLLAALADPPPLLLALGDVGFAARPVVAIVGARNASAAGRALAREIAHGLGEAGWVVASGLARGIDSEAHRGALATGTIACVAGGVDIAYPPENAGLQAEIAAAGLLLSELPPGTEPQARHFPRRNRLIAGVARGTLLIEAAPGSGSLITARLAGEAGREVMAVPGHPADPRSRGGNGLIRDGATLVESAADALAALSPFAVIARPEPRPRKPVAPRLAPKPVGNPPGEEAFLHLLSTSGVSLDELVRASGLSASAVQARLADLEIDGQVIRLAGGKVARAA
nr:DNA-processing protein DprA [Sandaracinobacteroides sayramensis]